MKNPAAFKPLYVLCEKHPNQPMLLTFAPERGFFEPVTNGAAEPVIGSVLGWCYRSEDDAEDRAIFDSLTAHGVNSPYIKPANRSVPGGEVSSKEGRRTPGDDPETVENGDSPYPLGPGR